MESFRFSLIFSIILIIFCFTNARADEKRFARSYTAYTLPANGLEFEFWQTGRIDKGSGYYYRWQPRFEVEYGVTDRLTASMYFNFNEVKSSQNTFSSKPFGLSTTSFEFRYRLSNPDEYIIDPALYFEFGYGGDKIFYEPKILLSKRFDKFSSVINLVSEIERFPASGVTESKFEISGGIAYELSANISIGMEFRNHRNYSNIYEKELNQASFIGPTVSFHVEKLYLVVNFLSQVSGGPGSFNNLDYIGHEKYEIRTILGVSL
ncbi:MAG: hypothetical protein CVV24_05410 [Ignavibacteriae bacterium HGW-Ignavibacteriae-3]|nr:MAG: hypothetical protein CVV24_05410 [Ignavibacteriae bacterium HGW-Ignavibacteriae-3]